MDLTLKLNETQVRQLKELEEAARRGDRYAKEALANINAVTEDYYRWARSVKWKDL
jgi:hypothetical protein